MIRVLFLATLVLIFNACSFKTPQNDWQYKSSSIFDSYVKNYLASNALLAKSDLKRATRQASMGANITPLAKIYLGECALKISVSKETSCPKYKKIRTLVEDKSTDAYYLLITDKISLERVDYLPKQYQTFVKAMLKKDFIVANKTLQNIEPTTSKLLAGALLKENINKKSIQNIIDDATFNGYKKAVLFWLKQLEEKSTQAEEKKKILQKIELLKSIK